MNRLSFRHLAAVTGMLFAAISGTTEVVAEPPYKEDWNARISSGFEDGAFALSIEPTGHVFVAGRTEGDLGAQNVGSADIFLAEYDRQGNEVVVNQYGSAAFDAATAIAVDNVGNAYIAGATSGDLCAPNSGFQDALLMKVNASGSVEWCVQPGTTNSDAANSVSIDASGNVYLGGVSDQTGLVASAFLSKYDSDGGVLWSQQLRAGEYTSITSLKADVDGNVIVTGSTTGAVAGTNSGVEDLFVAKFDSTGATVWSQQFGTNNQDGGTSLALDTAGNICIAGCIASLQLRQPVS